MEDRLVVKSFMRSTKSKVDHAPSRRILYEFIKGINAYGDEGMVVFEEHEKCDLAVIFGYGGNPANVEKINPRQIAGIVKSNPGRVAKYFRSQILEEQKKTDDRTICIDSGLFRSQGNKNTFFRIALDSPMRGGGFLNENSPPDRLKLIENKIGMTVKPWRETGSHIVLCLQPKNNWSMDGKDPIKWAHGKISEIRQFTNRVIKVRSHPGRPEDLKKLNLSKFKNIIKSTGIQKNFTIDLENCWAVFAYNSTALVDAAVEGIPVFVDNDACMAWEICNKNVSDINDPFLPDRQQWLNNLCYGMWSYEEMADGTVWKRFRGKVINDRK